MNRIGISKFLLAVLSFVLVSCGSTSDSASSSSVDGSAPFDFEDWTGLQIGDLGYKRESRGSGYDNQFWAFEIVGTYAGSNTGTLERLVEGILGDDGILVGEYSTYERYNPDSFGRSDFYSADVVPGTKITTIFWFETDGAVKDVQIVLKSNGNTINVKPGIEQISEDATSGKVCGDGGTCSYQNGRLMPEPKERNGWIVYTPEPGIHAAKGIEKLNAAAAKHSDGTLCPQANCKYIETVNLWPKNYAEWSEIDDDISQLHNSYRDDFKIPNIEVLLLMCKYLFSADNGGYASDCASDTLNVSDEKAYGDCVWSSSYRGDKILGLVNNGNGPFLGLLDQKNYCRLVLVSLL